MATPAELAAATAATAADKPSLTEHAIASFIGTIDHLLRQDPEDIALNAAASAVVIAVAWVAGRLLHRLFDRALARISVGGEADVAATRRAARLTWGLMRIAVGVGVGALVLEIWGVEVHALTTGDLGARLLRLALVVILSTALVEVSGFVIRRLIDGFARRSGDPRRAAQLRTLGPILTGVVQTLLVTVGALTVLTELGLKVAPILASAGVLGIAVGFGAQTLVKDFLTGLFLIAEDVVSVGDNVEIGGFSGVVEAMTLRTIRLRDANATLHIFPYSEAQVIHNRTKSFSSYLADIPVSYDNDLDHALDVLWRVGEGLRDDPAFKAVIVRPFEVLGVDRLADNAVYLKARFTTTPGGQWEVGREFNRRLMRAFEAEGVLTPVKTTPVQAQPLATRTADAPPPP